MTIPADDRDREIMRARMAKLDERDGPRVGDYVIFADGVTRRISYLWDDGAQTTDGDGSFYLGDHGCSYSGALHPPVPTESLTLTDERYRGPVWIFHHDWPAKDCGVNFAPLFRVYTCNREAN